MAFVFREVFATLTSVMGDTVRAIELANQLEREKAFGRLAKKLLRHDLIVINELGYLRISQWGGQLLFHLSSKLYENTSLLITTNLAFADWLQRFGDGKMTTDQRGGRGILPENQKVLRCWAHSSGFTAAIL